MCVSKEDATGETAKPLIKVYTATNPPLQCCGESLGGTFGKIKRRAQVCLHRTGPLTGNNSWLRISQNY